MAAQLFLFEESETEKLNREVKELKESLNNLRKGMFARHNELFSLYMEHEKKLKEPENQKLILKFKS